MFVQTIAAKEVFTRIEEQSCVVVIGNSGTGKTFIDRHIALKMKEEGYVIVPAEDPEGIKKYFKHGCKTLFVFDNLCGEFTLNQTYLDNWKSKLDSIKSNLKDNCCKILVTSRLRVFKDEIIKMPSVFENSECDIYSECLGLLPDGRNLFIKRYFGEGEITTINKYLSNYDFFPFLCGQLKGRSILELENCMKNPFSFF